VEAIAKIIGEASIRLTASGKGLAAEFRRIITTSLREASVGVGDGSTDGITKDAERNASKTRNILSGLFSFGSSGASTLASSLLGAVTQGGKLALIGAQAGIALAGISSLVTGAVGLVGVLGQVAGAAGLLPAALISIKAVSATLKLALDGVGESFSALASGDAKAFQESLKGLAPAAREFVTETAKLKPAFDSAKLQLQQNLFEGLAESVKPLGQRYLPLVNDFFGQIGRTANTGAKALVDFANDGEVAGQVSVFAGNIETAFQQLMPALTPVASALLDIGQVGSGFLPGLAEGVSNLAGKFGEFIRQSAASGQLAAFFQKALDTIKQLGEVLVQFGGGFAAVFNAANQAGGGFLDGLLAIGTAFNQFASSTAGQEALVGFFTAMHSIIASVLPVVTSLAGVIGRDLAPILANLAGTIGPAFLPVVEALGSGLRAAGPGIAVFAKGFADVIVAAAPLIRVLGEVVGLVAGALGEALSAIAPAIRDMAVGLVQAMPAFGELAKGMGEIIKAAAPLFPVIAQIAGVLAGALGKALQAVAPALESMAKALADGLVEIMPKLAPIISSVATTLGQLLTALIPLIPAFFQILTAILPILPPLLQLVAAVLPALVQLVQAVVPIIVALASVFTNLIPIFTEVVQIIIGVLMPPIKLIAAVVTAVAQVVASVFDSMAGAIRTVIGGIGSFITGIWGSIVSVFTGAVNSIRNFVVDGFNRIRDFFGSIMGNIASAVGQGIDNAIQFFRDLPGNILKAVENFGNLLFEAGRNLLEGLWNGIKSLANTIITRIKNFAHDMTVAMFEALGIRSPSKVFHGIGVNVVKGLALGIDDAAHMAVDAATALASSTISALDPFSGGLNVGAPNVRGGDGASAGGAAGGGLVLQQTNVMQPGADVTQFANEVWKRGASDLASGNSTLNVGQGSVQSGMAIPGSVVNLGA
jgi:phage-related protein